MISDAEVRVAEWILKKACQERTHCCDCPHYDNCGMSSDDEEGYPNDWDVPAPPPEPTERQRIEWLRCLPDDEMLDAVNHIGPHSLFPWHEVVSLGQFRKDVGLK